MDYLKEYAQEFTHRRLFGAMDWLVDHMPHVSLENATIVTAAVVVLLILSIFID
jgi:uncharacterized protein (DUF2342 family)